VFKQDWRTAPLTEKWAELLQYRNSQPPADQAVAPSSNSPLERPEFEAAVKQTLRNLRRPDLLAQNPLLSCRLVREAAQAGPATETLVELIERAADLLRQHPATRSSTASSTAPTYAPPTPRRSPPNCSTCPPAPIGAISPEVYPAWQAGCGTKRTRRSPTETELSDNTVRDPKIGRRSTRRSAAARLVSRNPWGNQYERNSWTTTGSGPN
jgi:hypothetical protein